MQSGHSKTNTGVKLFQVLLGLVFIFSLLGVQPTGEAFADDGDITFAVITDYGYANNTTVANVANMVNGWEPEFIVSAGDNQQGSTCDATTCYPGVVGAYYGPGSTPTRTDFMTTGNFYPVPGNHDYMAPISSYQSYFNYLPGSTGGSAPLYYHFVRGPVHFFMIDSGSSTDGSPDQAQKAWLETALSASTAPWKIVMFHVPAYSGGMHGDSVPMQWSFAQWGADFVISGHNHVYERIPKNEGASNNIPIVYYTAGTAGSDVRTGSQVGAYYYSGTGAMRLEASETSIKIEYVRISDGTAIDTQVYTKESPTDPSITTSVNSLVAFNTTPGTASVAQTYNVSGVRLNGDISIAAVTGYEYSTNGTTYSPNLSLTQTGGNVGTTTIYVRLTGTTAGTFNGSIAHSSSGATTRNVSVNGTVSALTPIINVSTSSLSSFTTTVGAASTARTYTVSGSNLTANINIAAVTGYEYSTNGTTYSPNLSLTQTGGNVGTTTIYVRLTGTTAGTFNGSIAHSSSGATTRNVSVNGTVSALTPIINVSTSSLSSFSTTVGVASPSQTYTVSGSNLTGNIAITAPTGFQISLSEGGTYSSSLNLSHSGGTVGSTTIYVRLYSTTASSYGGDITHTSGTTAKNVAVSGTVTALSTPTVNVSPTSLSSFSTTVGVASPLQTYTVSGSNLTGNIAITAPTGFQISLSEGGTYSSSLNLSHSGGTVGSTTIYVRLYSTTASSYGGNITHASTSATNNVAVSGTVSEVPTPTNYFIFLPLITK